MSWEGYGYLIISQTINTMKKGSMKDINKYLIVLTLATSKGFLSVWIRSWQKHMFKTRATI